MPALAPVSPAKYRKILESEGWRLHDQDEFHWIMQHPEFDEPHLIPKEGVYRSFCNFRVGGNFSGY